MNHSVKTYWLQNILLEIILMEREKNQVGSRLVVSTIRDYINNIHSKLDMLIDTINTLMELDHKELE